MRAPPTVGATASSDLIPSPNARVVATVANAHHVREALAAMHREGRRFEELDLFGQIPVLAKELPHGAVYVVVDAVSRAGVAAAAS